MSTLIAAISLIASTIMGGVAWHLTREERRRSRARVAVLASDLADLELRPAIAAGPGGDLFRVQEPGHSRFAAVPAVGGFAVAAALALIVVTSRSSQSALEPRGALTATGPKLQTTTDSAPLELVALDHARDGDRLTVRGVVRNPTAGVERDGVAVVVFLFNRDGAFLTGGLAAVDAPTLVPGSRSGFNVTVPHASEVGRYRVSFRSGDLIVPHVDRRDHGPVAQVQ